MVVGPLRMKDTRDDFLPNEKRERKRRHKTRSPSVDPPPRAYYGDDAIDRYSSNSSSASRPFNSYGGRPTSSHVHTTDELVVHWTTTSLNLATRLLTAPLTDDREFRTKLQDALRAENDDIRLETLIEDDLDIPQRWQRNPGCIRMQSDLSGHQLSRMEPEVYEEYIRKRMWSRSNSKQYLHHQEQEQKRREKRQRLTQERAKQKLEARQRAEKKAIKESRRFEKDRQKCRDCYYRRWEVINSVLSTSVPAAVYQGNEPGRDALKRKTGQIIRFEEIPWPQYPSENTGTSDEGVTSPEQLDSTSVREFLVGHLPSDDVAIRKKTIRTALFSYHPDRFDRLIEKVKDTGDNLQKAKQLGLRVSQILTELNKAVSTNNTQ